MVPAAEPSLVRSWLFCPGSTPGRFDKAARSGADAVVVDLEDAVASGEKDAARRNALAWLAASRTSGVVRAVRMNALRTIDGFRDLLGLVESEAAPDYVIVPKADSADELRLAATWLAARGTSTRLLALVETARGLAVAEALAAQVAGLVLGGADLAADLGAEMAWEPLLFARARLVQAAAVAGVAMVDVPCLALDDASAVREETLRARRLGFTGKLAIHPSQVPAIHAAFAPTADEVERARRVIAAARAAAGGVVVVDGRMVDAPIVRAAERTLALAARQPAT
jgi:citrate lyase beta subunit